MPEAEPLRGRKLWFAGIGGAGLSGYAVLARAWGADVSGWDRQETPYLALVRESGIPVRIADEPGAAPPGAETVVSSAFAAHISGTSRAAFLAELVRQRPSVVVAGAHGKTTTAAMIAFCLDRVGHDPSFVIGGEVPQLGGNARAGKGWLVVEGDESDRTIAALRPRIAVVTNVDLDHHATFASTAEVADLFERWLAEIPQVVRGDELEPATVALMLPGEHNRRNAACALAALELIGVPRTEAASQLSAFGGVGRRFELRGERGGVSVYDDYAHNPAKLAAALAGARERTSGRVLVGFQPHLYSRTAHTSGGLAAALTAADAACVTEIYAAREQPQPGVTGKLVLDRLVELRPGVDAGWTPAVEDAARFLARRARPGDLVLTAGAGDIDRAAALVLEAL